MGKKREITQTVYHNNNQTKQKTEGHPRGTLNYIRERERKRKKKGG